MRQKRVFPPTQSSSTQRHPSQASWTQLLPAPLPHVVPTLAPHCVRCSAGVLCREAQVSVFRRACRNHHVSRDAFVICWFRYGGRTPRSEERRVGKECRSRWAAEAQKKKESGYRRSR